MNLSQLIQEAIERFEKEFGLNPDSPFKDWEVVKREQKKLDQIKDFLKTELQTIVKESFKNTRVEERIWENETGDPLIYGRKDGYEIALIDKHNKECEFLGN